MSSSNLQWVLAEYPQGKITDSHFRVEPCPTPTVQDGQVIIKLIAASVDPYMRTRMKPGPGYIMPGFELNQPMDGFCVGQVTESRYPQLAIGDVVSGFLKYQLFQASAGEAVQKVSNPNLDPKLYIGLLGLTGISAYAPCMEIGQPKPGEVAFVSGAAGAVGMVAGQVLKLKGCRVVGCAGSDEKCQFLLSLGFDAAFNYKTVTNWEAKLAELFPNGVDIYFDNVGGEILDATLKVMNTFGRIIACGSISSYEDKEDQRYGVKNLFYVVTKQLRFEGFLFSKYKEQQKELYAQLEQWIISGQLKDHQTVFKGFDQLGKAMIGLFSGANTGKMVVEF